MAGRTNKRSNVVDAAGRFGKGAELSGERCTGWLGFQRELLHKGLEAADAQMEIALAMQLGYLDFLKNLLALKPPVKPFVAGFRPYTAHLEHLSELSSDIIELKKNKAHALAANMKKYRRQTFDSTMSAFDKYCDMLSTA